MGILFQAGKGHLGPYPTRTWVLKQPACPHQEVWTQKAKLIYDFLKAKAVLSLTKPTISTPLTALHKTVANHIRFIHIYSLTVPLGVSLGSFPKVFPAYHNSLRLCIHCIFNRYDVSWMPKTGWLPELEFLAFLCYLYYFCLFCSLGVATFKAHNYLSLTRDFK